MAQGYSVYYILTYILRRLESLDLEKPDREDLARRSNAVLRRLDQNDPANKLAPATSPAAVPRRIFPFPLPFLLPLARSPTPKKGRRERIALTPYEQKIVTEVVAPEDIGVTFESIGGLDAIIDELRESVIYPLTSPHLFAGHSSLLTAPKGVLLYGPPGCGKTMLAKALARESGACFINLHISTLTEKWYGDSNKMVNAVFSLARKLQPCIIFIDEIDAVLRQRSAQDHEASAMVKAEFMTCWDGLLSSAKEGGGGAGGDGSNRIMVLGATNRINDIDEAILRRLPKKFHIPLPDAAQRMRILKLILRDTKLDDGSAGEEGGERAGFSYDELVRLTAGFSGSDLKEACRDAAMVPLREMIRRRRKLDEGEPPLQGGDGHGGGLEKPAVRGVRNSDFFREESGGRWAAMGLGGGGGGGGEVRVLVGGGKRGGIGEGEGRVVEVEDVEEEGEVGRVG